MWDFNALLDNTLSAADKLSKTYLSINTSIANAQLARDSVATKKAETASKLAILRSQTAAQNAAAQMPVPVQASIGFFERNQTAIIAVSLSMLVLGLWMRGRG